MSKPARASIAVLIITFTLMIITNLSLIAKNKLLVSNLEARQDSIINVIDSLKYDIFEQEYTFTLYEAKYR